MLTPFLAALRYLTLVGARDSTSSDRTALERAGLFFPLIGLGIGVVVWTAGWLLRPLLPGLLLSSVLVGMLAVVSRGTQLHGLCATAESLGRGSPHRPTLAAWQTAVNKPIVSRCAGGSLMVVLLVKLYALTALHGGYRDVALLVGPMLGRWAWVVMAYSSRPRQTAPHEGVALVRAVHFNDFGLASLVALGVLFTLTEVVGIALVIPLGGLIIGFSLYCNRRLGGADINNLGAVGELVETATLCLLVLLAAASGGSRG